MAIFLLSTRVKLDSMSPVGSNFEITIENPFESDLNIAGQMVSVHTREESQKLIETSVLSFHEKYYKPGISKKEFLKIYHVFAPHVHIYCQPPDENLSHWKIADHLLQGICEALSDEKSAQQITSELCKKSKLPLIATVMNPHSKSADDVDQDIYLINASEKPIEIVKASSAFYTTVDEETGGGITTGAPELKDPFVLLPKSYLHTGNILGWELDSALWMDVWYKKEGSQDSVHLSFDLKSSALSCTPPYLNQRGFIYRPKTIKN